MTRRQFVELALLPTWLLLATLLLLGLRDPRAVSVTLRLGDPALDQGAETELYRSVRRTVQEEYYRQIEADELLYRSLDGMVSSLDPHSRFHPPDQAQAASEQIEGEYAGLGILIRAHESLPFIEIVTPFAESPAARAGVEAGDLIAGFDEDGKWFDGREKGLEWARQSLAGKRGSTLRLTVKRYDPATAHYDRQESFTITREVIQTPSVVDIEMLDPENAVGSLRITDFSKHTPEEFDRAYSALLKQGCRRLIIDLRQNGGGLLGEAVAIVDRLLSKGIIVSVRGRDERHREDLEATPDQLSPPPPLVVLVDEGSASASEIVAGALQDHHRALLIGEPTYGKGSVQNIIPFSITGPDGEPRDTALRLTIAHYYTPSGRGIERSEDQRGSLEPDLLAPLTEVQRRAVIDYWEKRRVLRSPAVEAREGPLIVPDDPQRRAALAALRGEPVYDRLSR